MIGAIEINATPAVEVSVELRFALELVKPDYLLVDLGRSEVTEGLQMLLDNLLIPKGRGFSGFWDQGLVECLDYWSQMEHSFFIRLLMLGLAILFILLQVVELS